MTSTSPKLTGCLGPAVGLFFLILSVKVMGLSIVTGIVAISVTVAGQPGAALIPFLATLVLLLTAMFFAFLGTAMFSAIRSTPVKEQSSAEQTAPQVVRIIGAALGACAGTLVGAVIGLLIAFSNRGWPMGLLAFGGVLLACTLISYAHPQAGFELLSNVFQVADGL